MSGEVWQPPAADLQRSAPVCRVLPGHADPGRRHALYLDDAQRDRLGCQCRGVPGCGRPHRRQIKYWPSPRRANPGWGNTGL